ncbi:MAG: tetratricopeptide repeat protein [archaeon]|nr:tetratricopeptide repeat protein [archaeon]
MKKTDAKKKKVKRNPNKNGADTKKSLKKAEQESDMFRILGMKRSYFASALIVIAVITGGLIFSYIDSNSPKGMVLDFTPGNVTIDTPSFERTEEFNSQITLCNQYIAVNDHNNSIECLKKAESIKNDDVRVVAALGELYFITGNYSESLKYYSRAVELEPGNKKTRYGYGLALEGMNRTYEAMDQYRAAIEIDSDYVPPRNDLGVLFQKLGMLNESREEFETAFTLNPNNTGVVLNYANVLAELGLKEDAEANYKKAISLDPENEEVYRNYAQFLYNNGRYAEAKDMLEKS